MRKLIDRWLRRHEPARTLEELARAGWTVRITWDGRSYVVRLKYGDRHSTFARGFRLEEVIRLACYEVERIVHQEPLPRAG